MRSSNLKIKGGFNFEKALFLLLDEFADWEGAHLSSTLNQDDSWSVSTVSVEKMYLL